MGGLGIPLADVVGNSGGAADSRLVSTSWTAGMGFESAFSILGRCGDIDQLSPSFADDELAGAEAVMTCGGVAPADLICPPSVTAVAQSTHLVLAKKKSPPNKAHARNKPPRSLAGVRDCDWRCGISPFVYRYTLRLVDFVTKTYAGQPPATGLLAAASKLALRHVARRWLSVSSSSGYVAPTVGETVAVGLP